VKKRERSGIGPSTEHALAITQATTKHLQGRRHLRHFAFTSVPRTSALGCRPRRRPESTPAPRPKAHRGLLRAPGVPRKNKPGFRGAERVEAGSLGRRSAARLGPEELLRGAHAAEDRARRCPSSGGQESRGSDCTSPEPKLGRGGGRGEGKWPGGKPQVLEDGLGRRGTKDDGDDAAGASAARAGEDVRLERPLEQFGPGDGAAGGGAGGRAQRAQAPLGRKMPRAA